MSHTYKEVHINDVRDGDIVFHDGHDRTLSRSNFKRCGFMGTTIYGDSYQLGNKPVLVRTI
jgi:hypothetical protein